MLYGVKYKYIDVASPVVVQASRQSLVLLKNANSTLPFSIPRSGKVVVVGPSANSTRLLGGGHYARNMKVVDGFETEGIPGIPGAVAALLASSPESSATVRYLPGIRCTPRTDSVCIDPRADAGLLADAVAACKDADTAQVIVVAMEWRPVKAVVYPADCMLTVCLFYADPTQVIVVAMEWRPVVYPADPMRTLCCMLTIC